jgi:hypothetical protein
MTVEEYRKYSDITMRLFNFMNGRINQMNNNCILSIDPYDLITNTYGNIKYPNLIFIHIGTVVDAWREEWSKYIDKDDYIGSCLAWAISHELHHADQLISMIMYNRNIDYKNKIESDVERASYDWVCNHAKEISQIGGFNVLMNKLQSESLPEAGNYTRANSKQFYLQTIANIIIRDLDLYESLKVFTNDNICDDMILIFNSMDTVVIKSNGRYLDENVVQFSRLAYEYCGKYNMYHIYVDVSLSHDSNGRCIGTVQFKISSPIIHPMTFKDDISPISL